MCNWSDVEIVFRDGKRVKIPAATIIDACEIIKDAAKQRRLITYTEIMDQLKARGNRKINRATIGGIVGEVSAQVSKVTNPSIYPSAIVVLKGTNYPGNGFWGIDTGTNPPKNVPEKMRRVVIRRYQDDIFSREWDCNC